MEKTDALGITGGEYTAFEAAYDWFNAQLFENALPPCLITLQRKARSRGYFANDRFEHRGRGKTQSRKQNKVHVSGVRTKRMGASVCKSCVW